MVVHDQFPVGPRLSFRSAGPSSAILKAESLEQSLTKTRYIVGIGSYARRSEITALVPLVQVSDHCR